MDQTAGQTGQADRERTSTLIGADVVIRGDVEGPTDLHLHGRVTGKVAVIGLIVEKGAEIEGPVTADAVAISGHVNGSIEARTVHLTATARVEGDVAYSNLQIDAGARLSGRCAFSEGAEQNVVKLTEANARGTEAKPELGESGQELVRLAARLRRAAD